METNEEIELKVLEINTEKVIKELINNNAQLILDTLTEIWSFDIKASGKIDFNSVPSKLVDTISIANELTSHGKSLRNQNYHLRARKQADNYEFTLKYSKSINNIVKKEVELNTNLSEKEWEEISKIMTNSGLIITAHQNKKRISYEIEDDSYHSHFDIDTWPGIPTYLEIEARNSDTIFYWLKKLHLGKYKTTTLSGEKFFKMYNVDFYSEIVFNE